MNFYHLIISLSLLSLPLLAKEARGNLLDFVPDGKLLQGNMVRPVVNLDLSPILAKMQAKFNNLPVERQQAIREGHAIDSALDYTPDLWDSPEEYDTYLATWNRSGSQLRDSVVFGMKPTGTPHVWSITSAYFFNGKAIDFPLATFLYHDGEDTWTTQQGILKGEACQTRKNYLFGALSGRQWSLEKQEDRCCIKERIRVLESADGSFLYLFYHMVEIEVESNRVLAQSNYCMRLHF